MPIRALTGHLASAAALCLLAGSPALAQGPGNNPGPNQRQTAPGQGTSMDRGNSYTQGSGFTQDTRTTPGVTPGLTPGAQPHVQSVPPTNTEPTGTPQTTGINLFDTRPVEGQLWRGSELIGQTVYNRQNQPIGEVKEFVIDRDGRVSIAVVGFGGVLGTMGQRQVAINYAAIQTVVDTQNKSMRLVLDADAAAMRDAPEFRQPEAWRRQ